MFFSIINAHCLSKRNMSLLRSSRILITEFYYKHFTPNGVRQKRPNDRSASMPACKIQVE
jgi:hypothetical protein